MPFNETVDALGQVRPKTYVLIVCQSSFGEEGFQLRQAIRQSWASETKILPATVVFLLGDPRNSTQQAELEEESKTFGDILQENFVDAYNNLTLKSMFMLKFVSGQISSLPEDSIKFLLKVDDDCFVNIKALLKYSNILARYSNTMVGHVLGEDSPVIRPRENSTTQRYTTKWEVPFYIYQGKETFPNALSGSGYLMRSDDVGCLYRQGLDVPFVNLEDIFITGLAAKRCRLKLRSSPKFHFLGKHICHLRPQDILVHNIKDPQKMRDFFEVVRGKKPCKS